MKAFYFIKTTPNYEEVVPLPLSSFLLPFPLSNMYFDYLHTSTTIFLTIIITISILQMLDGWEKKLKLIYTCIHTCIRMYVFMSIRILHPLTVIYDLYKFYSHCQLPLSSFPHVHLLFLSHYIYFVGKGRVEEWMVASFS